MPAGPLIADLAPPARVATIMDALCRAMAEEANKRRIAGPLVILIWTRLRRLADRLLIALCDARPSPPRARTGPDNRIRPPRLHVLPRGFAWLRRLIPGTAGAASQLAHLLAEPECAALIAANPATGRALRPLCHLLGLRPPPSLRRPRPVAARKPPAAPAPTARSSARPPKPAPSRPPSNPARPPPPPGSDPRNPSAPRWSSRAGSFTPAPYTRPVRA